MFYSSWTTYLEQLTCQSVRHRSQLHRIQKTTEPFRPSTVHHDFFDYCALQILSLTYLLTCSVTFWGANLSQQRDCQVEQKDDSSKCSVLSVAVFVVSWLCL